MSKSANLFATLRHDAASKTVALEFVDSVSFCLFRDYSQRERDAFLLLLGRDPGPAG